MQLTGRVLVFSASVIILCHNLCTGAKWEDEDTVVVEASIEEPESKVTDLVSRAKRQIGTGNSMFTGIPGWGMIGNGIGGGSGIGGGGLLGFGGFQLPGFSGGMHGIFQFPSIQKPQLQPVAEPVKPVESSCYTSNGEIGVCAKFSSCYPLLFATETDEQRNPGLAYMLRASAGACPAPSQNYRWWYNSEIANRQSPICCSSETQPSPVPSTPATPVTTTSYPGWPPPYITHPPAVTQAPQQMTTRQPWQGWPPQMITHPTSASTTAPTQRTSWPGWPPQMITHPTPPPTPATQKSTSWPGWPPQSLQTTMRPAWPPQSGNQVSASTQASREPYNCPGAYIIGGTPVQGRSYPYIVSIKDGRTNRHLCGGSLLSARSVLTAAHCVKQLGPQQVAGLRAFLGANNIASTFNNPCTVVRKVRNIKYHRGFSMRTLHDDIAILTLESPVTIGGNIQTVSLGAARVAAGGKAVVTGWGGLALGGQPVGDLRHVTLDVIGNDLCAAKYVGSAPAGITQHMVCAGSPGRDACLGDSGGPLIQNGQQVGIVSFGTGCGTLPGVYTRISSYISWINKNTS